LVTLRYPAVLFDIDGTLLDSAQDIVASVRHALRLVDAREPPDRDAILIETGKPLETIYANLGYPPDSALTQRFITAYREHFAVHMSDHTRPYPQARETLATLRQAGVRLAVVTTKLQAQAELAVRAGGLDSFFDYVHGWSEGRRHKPDPEPVLDALAALGAEPGQALMVGDSEQDVLAARAAGVDSCAVTYGFRPPVLLRFLRPDFMISRLDDLIAVVLNDAAGG
jgi:2-phosphoglycolate phosphatase